MEVLSKAEKLVKSEHPGVHQNALNKVRGDWYESLIALGASQYAIENKARLVIVPLPNVRAFSCENLYIDKISDLVVDLRKVLKKSVDVSLISSNPDFVIVPENLVELKDTSKGQVEDIEYLSSIYKKLAGQCEFSDIIGYCSVKTGLKPDRRLQIAHEGSLMKALYRHIQTRLWTIDAQGIRYFGITASCNNADRLAMKTIATHSIVDVSSVPESAVNALFAVNSGEELKEALATILAPSIK